MNPSDLTDLGDGEPDMAAALDERSRRTLRWTKGLLLGVLALGVLLTVWQKQIASVREGASLECIRNAFFIDAGRKGCVDTLEGLVLSVVKAGPISTGANDQPSAREWAFNEPGWPRIFVWADNLFVDVYTLLFVAVVWRSFARFELVTERGKLLCKAAFLGTVALCLVGAVSDHSENFWLLAHIGTATESYGPELPRAATLSLIKNQLFALNVVLSLLWVFACKRSKPR